MFAKTLIVLLVSVVAWAAFVHPSEATSGDQTYVVQPGDTLWEIASTHYAGDPREAVWRVREANDLGTATLHPGQRLTLP
jgi:nucleoid-associated protein YgaU